MYSELGSLNYREKPVKFDIAVKIKHSFNICGKNLNRGSTFYLFSIQHFD